MKIKGIKNIRKINKSLEEGEKGIVKFKINNLLNFIWNKNLEFQPPCIFISLVYWSEMNC